MIVVFVSLFMAGFILRLCAIRSLKNCFSLTLTRPENVKTIGLYKYIRHPSYLGSIIMLLSLCIIDVRLSFIYLTFIFYIARIKQEEGMMAYFFPKEYVDYMKNTWALFPKFFRKDR